MKTISGNCVSSKQISLSKAAKILSKFVSADNGASHVTSAYLHRASAAFNELKQLHTEPKSPHSCKKHKRHKTEVTVTDEDGEKSTQTVAKFSQEINGSIGCGAGNGGSEKHKMNKKKKHVESRHNGDRRVNS